MDDSDHVAVQDLLGSLIRKIVAFPEEVQIVPEPLARGATFHLIVDQRDVCRVLGPNNVTLRALRTVLRAAGAKCHREFDIVVDDLSGYGQVHVVSAARLPN